MGIVIELKDGTFIQRASQVDYAFIENLANAPVDKDNPKFKVQIVLRSTATYAVTFITEAQAMAALVKVREAMVKS